MPTTTPAKTVKKSVLKKRISLACLFAGYLCLCLTGLITITTEYGWVYGLAFLGTMLVVTGCLLSTDPSSKGD